MKFTLGLFVLLSFITLPAHAGFVPVDFTGQTAYRNDMLGYINQYDMPQPYVGSIGGPIANNTLGNALQFTLLQTTVIKDVNVDITMLSMNTDSEYGIDIDFILYRGNSTFHDCLEPIPNINNLIARTDHIVLTFDRDPVYPADYENWSYNDSQSFHDIDRGFDLILDPGDYWLAFERDDYQSMALASLSNLSLNIQPVPEPMTFSLYFLGVIVVVVFRGGGALYKR